MAISHLGRIVPIHLFLMVAFVVQNPAAAEDPFGSPSQDPFSRPPIQTAAVEYAERCLEVRFYKLPDVLAGKSDQVIKALQATVQTDVWDVVGGPCAAAQIDHVIVVSGTESLHEAVDEFLEQLAAAFE